MSRLPDERKATPTSAPAYAAEWGFKEAAPPVEASDATGSVDAGDLPACAQDGRTLLERVRKAFDTQDFETARRCWEEYADGVRLAIEDRTATPMMLREMRELVEWSRIVVLSFRAHAADRLGQDHAARAYR